MLTTAYSGELETARHLYEELIETCKKIYDYETLREVSFDVNHCVVGISASSLVLFTMLGFTAESRSYNSEIVSD